VTLLVDTSVWSLALRRSPPATLPETAALRKALEGGDIVVTTGLVLQELLQGFSGPRDASAIVEKFASLPLVMPDRQDHVDAAGLRNECRRSGVQIGTVDALIAQLCLRHELTLLTTDDDFRRAASIRAFPLWTNGQGS
jgi:predicted nucleic acid-binding protein